MITLLTIQQPNEIGPALVRDPKAVFRAWWALFDSYRLDEWLRAINWQPLEETLKFLADVRYWFLEQPHSQTYAVLWRFAPNLPFFLDGKGFNSPQELAQAIDHQDIRTGSWQTDIKSKFITVLQNGQLLAWLMGTGRIGDTAPLRQLLMNNELSWFIRVEQVLQLLDPQRSNPILAVDRSYLRLGVVSRQSNLPKTNLVISNNGGGYLFGNIGWEQQVTGMELNSYRFENVPCTITISLKIPDWQPGTHSYQLHLHSNGGVLHIPISYFVPEYKEPVSPAKRLAELLAPLRKINRWVIIGMGIFLWTVITWYMD